MVSLMPHMCLADGQPTASISTCVWGGRGGGGGRAGASTPKGPGQCKFSSYNVVVMLFSNVVHLTMELASSGSVCTTASSHVQNVTSPLVVGHKTSGANLQRLSGVFTQGKLHD
jgi:hypothetical protein